MRQEQAEQQGALPGRTGPYPMPEKSWQRAFGGRVFPAEKFMLKRMLERMLESIGRSWPRSNQDKAGRKLFAPFQNKRQNTLQNARSNIQHHNIRGEFDGFVSVGMLEHVGVDNYQKLGGVIDRCLKNGGRGLIHTIGRDYARPMDAWISQHIFPGACPSSLAQMMRIFEPCEFLILDVENLRLHYPQSGEGIRTAVESGLMATAVILEARGDYSAQRLQAYSSRLAARFGAAPAPGNRKLKLARNILAELLMRNRWFTRHVVLDRWFLHAHQASMQTG